MADQKAGEGGREMSNSSSSFSLTGLEFLTVAFIVLKLTGVIDWSWWWVLSPTLIPVGIAIPLVIIYLWVTRWR